LPHGCAAPLQGEIYEYLDYFICDFVDCMDWRLDRFSCRRRPHPLITGFWSDISNTSFRFGKKSCIGIACTTLTLSSLSETLGTARKIFPSRAEPAGIRAKKSASASPKLEWRGNMELLRKTMPRSSWQYIWKPEKQGVIMEDKVGNGRTEGRFTGAIESQTSKIPSAGYLAAAFGAIATSAILKIAGKDDWALFVGQWPAAFMLMGVYNKMVKQHGSDAHSRVAA